MVTKNKKLIIAGPCAVESKQNFIKVVDKIYKHVDIIRAGVWKARTSPKDFSGAGNKALGWIKKAQKKYKIPFAIEVGTGKHVELALKHGIRIVWIGARTTCSPFTIQEIAHEAKGEDIEIWIKNPIFSDLKLWCGAIDRLSSNKIKIIHRGFYDENVTKFRNSPRWDLVKKIRSIYSKIPIICDPSHITGNRELIYSTSKKAISLDFDGLMIEVHNNPKIAMSDQNQQITPEKLIEILKRLGLK